MLVDLKNDSRWDRYLGMTAAMTQVPVPMTTLDRWKLRYLKQRMKLTEVLTICEVALHISSEVCKKESR